MNYRNDKYGNKLSTLGFGCMRFQTKMGKIDYGEAEKEVMYAIENGVNYFDTAYIYPGSEAVLGEILEKSNVRDKVKIATKLPHYLVKNREALDKIFDEELKRLRTDYIDYYFMHMLTDIDAWNRMIDLGILEWIEEKKKSGAIRQVGFSYHGNTDMFIKLIDAYDWEFCMIQYNYMDEHSQAGRRGLEYAHSKGLPVMIMEPLRGGRLVNRLPEDAKKIFKAYEKQHTPAQWAFKWLWSQKEVTVVLSGMNSMEMVEDNIRTASTTSVGDLSEKDNETLEKVVNAINSKMKVGCTGCGYCMPCPKNVDIPGSFAHYNRKYAEGWFPAMKEHIMCTALRKTPTSITNCIGCGKCEKHCPQNIPIREKLMEAKKELETPIYRIARKIAPKFVKF
ncbi:MAG: aldo/keto reductase [Ruminococcaceae bacterium]|nr:aldo/keto reductase [Oscillospiraceae bacterium]